MRADPVHTSQSIVYIDLSPPYIIRFQSSTFESVTGKLAGTDGHIRKKTRKGLRFQTKTYIKCGPMEPNCPVNTCVDTSIFWSV